MSRDMLSFDLREFNRYLFSISWIRLVFLKYVQLSSFKNSLATIFLTNYARNKISEYQKLTYFSAVINHGISEDFRINKKNKINLSQEDEIVLTYVSNADLYKHNWKLIEAVFQLRAELKMNIKLQLIGSSEGNPKALKKIEKAAKKYDFNNEFVLRTKKLNHNDLISYLNLTDIFIFASTCENMPNTLIEGMSTSLPILCSNYGPMPEIIQDSSILFNPEETHSIKNAINKMITDDELRLKLAQNSSQLSKNYSWKKCSNETFEFIENVMQKYNNHA
jgi:glycosyltransferase involved in cell wall biosynthesis